MSRHPVLLFLLSETVAVFAAGCLLWLALHFN
jgi:hypothetical protein